MQKITAYCIIHFSCVVKFFHVLAIIFNCPSTFAYKKQLFVSYTIVIVYHAHVAPFDSFTSIYNNNNNNNNTYDIYNNNSFIYSQIKNFK